MADVPKLKKHSNRRCINIMIDAEYDALYRLGKDNGHDTPAYVRDEVHKALKRAEKTLREKAKA